MIQGSRLARSTIGCPVLLIYSVVWCGRTLTINITLSIMKLSAFVLPLLLCMSFVVHATDKYAGFPQPKADYQAHIAEVKQYLLTTQMRQRKPEDVQFNIPFEYKANPSTRYRGKFLLIHGLNDSPYVFADVATELTARGFDVRAILLPGHGNSPEAQLDMSYKRWLNVARTHLNLWQEQSDAPMYIGGFSMGSVIATILALENENIKGLLLFSPAYQSSMNHLLRWSSLYSKFKPWVFGGMIIEDNPTKYNSIPINGAAQYYKLSKKLKRLWGRKRLNLPVLMVLSADDSVVDIEYLIKVYGKRFTSERKRMLIYSNDANLVDTPNIDYRPSAYPALRILNQSHQGVLMAPENPLFGKEGSVLVCNGNDWPTFSGCLYSRQKHWFGAQHTASPDTVPVARTTYNADFDGVFETFDQVFQ